VLELLQTELTSYALTELTSYEIHSTAALRSEKLLGEVVRTRSAGRGNEISARRPS